MNDNLQPGTRVKIGPNDAKVPTGTRGAFVKIVEETGNLLIDVVGKGRIALTPDSVQFLDGTPVRVLALAPAPSDGRPSGVARLADQTVERLAPGKRLVARVPGITRELYLSHGDAADELRLSKQQLASLAETLGMSKAVGIGNARTYTASDLMKLRQVVDASNQGGHSARFVTKMTDPEQAANVVKLLVALHGITKVTEWSTGQTSTLS